MEIKQFLDNKIEALSKADKTGGPRSERDEWLEKTAEMLAISIPRAAKHMQGWSIERMRNLYIKVQKEGKPPAALWWWHWKQDKKQK